MGIVVQQGAAWVQGASYLGYDNALLRDGAVVAASAADAGFPVSNAASWLITGGGWQATVTPTATLTLTLPAAETVNSFALYKHNMGDLATATVTLEYSDNGTDWTTFAGSATNPGDNKAIFFIGTASSHAYWRLNFENIAASETLIIGQAYIGNSLQMFSPPEPGFTPPELGLNNKYISSRADGGDFLGRSLIRRGSKMSFSNSIVAKDWVRDNWQDAMYAMEKTPFYYAWDKTNYPLEVAYCYVDKKISPPKYVNSVYMSLNLSFVALVE